MLTDMADLVIEPSLRQFEQEVIALDEKAAAFTASPSSSLLGQLKEQYIKAYRRFQHCKPFNIGPLMAYGMRDAMNVYPVDTTQIRQNIADGTSDALGSAQNTRAIGFPAVDYLLYRESESATVQRFSTDGDAASRKAYLTAVTSKMSREVTQVLAAWPSYVAQFTQADGNDIGSSSSMLFNAFVEDIELLKNAKIGIPAGFKSNGQVKPDYAEAYYAATSTALAKESMQALKTLFTGAEGLGFDDYIRDVEGASVATSLADRIVSQMDECIERIAAIGTPLSEKVATHPDEVMAAWQAVKKLVTYTKTDMSSMLGLLITYQDNDGD